MVPLTIFTPTYNRAALLTRGFESLKRQTCKDFLWLIIDDGSTDGTGELVSRWLREPLDFEVRYIHKENGGLHTAYNEAISQTETPLCVCVDSDDYMPEDAVEKILRCWQERGSDRVAGIVGLDCRPDGSVLGDPLPEQETVNLIDLLTGKYPLRNGDRTNVVRTELYKRYAPMKVFPGEKNFNPHYLHLQISRDYDFLVLNENLRFVEYQSGGMSDTIWRQYYDSPNSFAETRKLYLSFPGTSLSFRFRHAIHLVSSCILAGNFYSALTGNPRKWETLLAIPFGWLLAQYIQFREREAPPWR